ncbi:MAG: hypothetical protein J6X79_00670 [Bacteroidales bacterium]|nr:hypothetical protein [Bacteroidales bacterium]
MKIKYFAIPLTAALLLVGCKHQVSEAVDTVPMDEPEIVVAEEEQPAEEAERVPVLRKAQPANAKPVATAAPTNKNAKPETLYVETDGAQGRVWGHVTMKGDRGTGTIHDWDENTLAVTVTRHGDELFAVDQNSRLYVFKMKQNKTQQ